jgi:hypothetical protein
MDTNEVEVRRGEPNRRGVVFAAVAMSIDLARWFLGDFTVVQRTSPNR